jgi:NDP-sugar pyrophosphorylase family protein
MSLPVAMLAGGTAQRLRPLTETIPKALVEVAGRPFAEHQVEWLNGQGITRVVFLVGYLGEKIENALGDGSRFGLRIEYVFDGPTLLGTGGALRRASAFLGDAFFVMYGDSYLDCPLPEIERAFRASGSPALMTVLHNEDRWDKSNVRFEGGKILAYDKRNRTSEMKHIDYGLGVLRASALAGYPEGAPFDLALVYQELAAAGELAAYEVHSRFYEIGTPQGLEETRAHLSARGSAR